ncbi:protrudin isoform X2 [Antennarius striatus]|uniref:protrudin isoform X2 n=1 Tax=Antennarius striatus TaxID=241820 RepID=UPI0035ADBB63
MVGPIPDPRQSPGELDTSGSPEAPEPGAPRDLDLVNMVASYRRLALLLEPLADAVELTRLLLGWKTPAWSLLVCAALNVFFCTVNEAGWFAMGVAVLCVPAALGYLQDRCGGGASEAELQRRRYHAVQRRDLQTVHLSKQEALMEVKDLLKHMDELLSSVCRSTQNLYKVLSWEDQNRSTRFYGGGLALVVLLYMAPVGWVLAGLNSAIFLWNGDFWRVLSDSRKWFYMGDAQDGPGAHEDLDQEQGPSLDRTPTPTSVEDLSPGSVEEAEEAEPDDEFKDAIEEEDDGPPGAPDDDGASENGVLSRNEPIRSKVSKLTEKLRKRYPPTGTGNCSSCSAVFSVLKKRRSCSNCGNSFCLRCCSCKVLRSCMGATAPEAQRETVFVCAACNSALIKLQ